MRQDLSAGITFSLTPRIDAHRQNIHRTPFVKIQVDRLEVGHVEGINHNNDQDYEVGYCWMI